MKRSFDASSPIFTEGQSTPRLQLAPGFQCALSRLYAFWLQSRLLPPMPSGYPAPLVEGGRSPSSQHFHCNHSNRLGSPHCKDARAEPV